MNDYTLDEIRNEIEILKNTFEIVRLVNPIMGDVVKSDGRGGFMPSGCFCFEAWSKNTRCKNCISSLVLSNHGKASKLEYLDGALFYIVSRYVVVDGSELVLEAVSCLDREYSERILGEDGRTAELIRLYKQTGIDELTGLYNRRFLRAKLSELLLEYEGNRKAVGVLMFDMDKLKSINDTNGHFAGDAAIMAIADVLHAAMADDDGFVVRLGGDEFIAVFDNVDYESMKVKCDKLMRAVGRTEIKDYPMIKISVCAGGALSSECSGYNELLTLADKRLYKAKVLGTGKIVIQ